MRVMLGELPIDLRRRVAHWLESLRDGGLPEGATDARLGDEACAVYRPDIREVAYWEFEVVGLKATSARDRDGDGSGTGFMLATVGRHDYPLSHWSLEIEPPSRALEAKAKQAGAGGKVARIVKLDTLAYVAEDERGSYLAHVGQFPPAIAGSAAALKGLRDISTVTAIAARRVEDDSLPVDLTVMQSGAKVPALKLTAWRSWADAKARYATTYRTQLAALAEQATPSWINEELLAKYGEGIHEGQQLRVPLLKPGVARLVGDGARAVKLSQLNPDDTAVVLEAGITGGQSEASFALEIEYRDGGRERLEFFIVPKGAPSNFHNRLPHN